MTITDELLILDVYISPFWERQPRTDLASISCRAYKEQRSDLCFSLFLVYALLYVEEVGLVAFVGTRVDDNRLVPRV